MSKVIDQVRFLRSEGSVGSPTRSTKARQEKGESRGPVRTQSTLDAISTSVVV